MHRTRQLLGVCLSSFSTSAAAIVAAWVVTAAAEPVTVRVEVRGGASTEARVVAQRLDASDPREPAAGVPRRSDTEPAEDFRAVELPAPGIAKLDLGPGLWRLRAEATGFWSAPHDLWLAESEEAATLALWPTGAVAGTVTTPRGTPPPDEVGIRFQATPPADGPPDGSLGCPVFEGRFRCEVPAGTLDLRLRATGFVSHYRWGATLPSGDTLDLSRLQLEPGASLVGWVETFDGASISEHPPEIVLRARQPPPSGGEEPARRGLLRLVGRATDRGFFHFEGLPAGRYQIYAKLDGYATAEAEVDLYERAESVLRQPLLLAPPRTLDVEVLPSLDPSGRPWRLILTRWQDRRSVGEVEANASPDGRWRQEGLPEGDYSIVVIDAAGARRLHDRFRVELEDPWLVLEVPSLQVHGVVRLGDEPLAAQVIFGGEFGAVSVPFAAGPDGAYAGTLPRAGRWPVTIEVSEPPVRRELEVVVDADKAAGRDGARVDFELPNTRLVGQVVDEEGRAVGGAFVFVARSGDEEVVQHEVRADGGFELRGLAPVDLEVHAEGAGGSSVPVRVELQEDGQPPPLSLVLESNLATLVEVRSASGPVPGAQVLAVPKEANARAPIVATGVDGSAVLRHLPKRTRRVDLAVFAPGYAVRLHETSIADQDVVKVDVDQLGGALTVHIEGYDPRSGRHSAFLSRGGARIGWAVLLALADGHPTSTADGFGTTLPQMESGEYALCLANADDPLATAVPIRCAEGRLDPLGHLELRLEAPGEGGASSSVR
jgi:hypothetical protein